MVRRTGSGGWEKGRDYRSWGSGAPLCAAGFARRSGLRGDGRAGQDRLHREPGPGRRPRGPSHAALVLRLRTRSDPPAGGADAALPANARECGAGPAGIRERPVPAFQARRVRSHRRARRRQGRGVRGRQSRAPRRRYGDRRRRRRKDLQDPLGPRRARHTPPRRRRPAPTSSARRSSRSRPGESTHRCPPRHSNRPSRASSRTLYSAAYSSPMATAPPAGPVGLNAPDRHALTHHTELRRHYFPAGRAGQDEYRQSRSN